MYVVEWEQSALDDFANISMLHRSRWAEINAADNDIDIRLRRDPIHFGQHVSEGLWRIDSAPLAAYFSLEGNTVVIEKFGWIG